MKNRLSIKREQMFCIALEVYLLWINFVIGVKWCDGLMPVMSGVGRIMMISVVIILLSCVCARKRHARQVFLLFTLMLFVAAYLYIQNDDNSIVFLILFIFAVQDLEYDRIVKCYAVTQLFCIFGILAVHFLHLSVDVVTYFSYGSGRSLGTYHANNFATLVMTTYLAACYGFFRGKIKINIIISCLVVIFLWPVTMSRTNCALIILYPFALVILSLMKKSNSAFMLNLLRYLMYVVFGLTIVGTVAYDYLSTTVNDGTFLARFRFGVIAFRQYGIHLLGANIKYISTAEAKLLGTDSMVLDSAYLKMLFGYGIVFSLFVMYIISKIIKKAICLKDYEFVIICSLFVISGITQSTLIGVTNFTLLASYAIMNRKHYKLTCKHKSMF